MRRRTRHPDEHESDEAATTAPIVADPDAAPADELEEAAPVYPTEEHEREAIAAVRAAHPNLSSYAETRAVVQHLADNRARAIKRQRAAARALADSHAPVFPTEAHVLDLREAIPGLSSDDEHAVMRAGYPAFLASVDAGEPVLTVPDEQE